ncbi:MAG: hypothetical protein ACTS27_07010 [Phycisphaerales bacterium]
MNRSEEQPPERVTRDSPRTTAPDIGRAWQLRIGIVVFVLVILAIVLLVVRFGVGGQTDPTSNPAETPAEIQQQITPNSN